VDTNGGTLPLEMENIINQMKEFFGPDKEVRWGIHAHNDSGVAVANSLIAVHLGAIKYRYY
jgi:2-isopropylmalate synthase